MPCHLQLELRLHACCMPCIAYEQLPLRIQAMHLLILCITSRPVKEVVVLLLQQLLAMIILFITW